MKNIQPLPWYAVVVLGLSLASIARAQKLVDYVATGSPNGIYVMLGTKIASRAHPSHGVTGYRLERRTAGESGWQTVADWEAPADPAEFKSRLDQALALFPKQSPPKPAEIDTIWNRLLRYADNDSLRFWGTVVPVRLAVGVLYLDASAAKNVQYEYQVSEIDQHGTPHPTMISGKASWPPTFKFAPVHLQQKFAYEKQVILRWYAIGEMRACNFLAYRQEGAKGGYVPIQPQGVVMRNQDTTSYILTDTLVKPASLYQYYIIPMCQYGNTGSPSDTVAVATYRFADVPLPQMIRTRSADSVGGLWLYWRLAAPDYVRSVRIYRSETWDKGYVQVAELPPQDTTWLDALTEPMKKYYYYLEMTGLLGEVSAPSAQVFGIFQSSRPPMPPWHVVGEAVGHGARLKWRGSGKDIAGFYVYRGDGYKAELRQVTGLLPYTDSIMTWLDTSSALTGDFSYAYAVTAENTSHVPSATSETVYVRPTIAAHIPAPGEIAARAEDHLIRLSWQDLQYAIRGLKGYLVFRRGAGGTFQPLTDTALRVPRNHYEDTAIVAGRSYEYEVQAVDIFGNKSDLSEAAQAATAVPSLIPPAGLTATATSDGVMLQWDKPVQPGLAGYRVYRYQRGQNPTLLGSTAADDLQFTDGNARKGSLYFYYLTSTDQAGHESGPGREVGIRP